MNPDIARMTVIATVMASGFTLLWNQHESAAEDMRQRIERLENGKADKVEASDRWRRSEEIEYQKRVDAEIGELRRELEDFKKCSPRKTP